MMRWIYRLLDRSPMAAKLAFVMFRAGIAARNRVYDLLVRHTGMMPRSLSDRGQDRWVVREVWPGRTDGFFVEVGAGDGFSSSNTYVLEKRFGWDGLCIEANPHSYAAMVGRYARGCRCANVAVLDQPGRVRFRLAGQESQIVDPSTPVQDTRDAAPDTADVRIVDIPAYSLEQVLTDYGAPAEIDYMSIDIEGLEEQVLEDFPFQRYKIYALTVERPSPRVNEILFAQGFVFVKNRIYDSFYVHRSHPRIDRIPREPFEQLPPKNFTP